MLAVWFGGAASIGCNSIPIHGGHFAEWENPELIATDMREFFRNCGERDDRV